MFILRGMRLNLMTIPNRDTRDPEAVATVSPSNAKQEWTYYASVLMRRSVASLRDIQIFAGISREAGQRLAITTAYITTDANAVQVSEGFLRV